MTTKELYIKHKSGSMSNQKFLYEVRRDAHLPWITNLTSYEDAVKILKNKGIINEADGKKYGEVEVIAKTIDMVNPYEYANGLDYELGQSMVPVRCDLTEDEVLTAQKKVLDNLTKDPNYYTKVMHGLKPKDPILGPREIEVTDKTIEAVKKGPVKADGYIKKELKKDVKANVKDNLGDSEKAPKKPKGVEELKDKGVTGSVKTIKEGIEEIIREKLAKKKADEAKVEEAAGVSQNKKEKARAALSIHLSSAKEEGDKEAEKEVLDARDKIMKASSLKDIVSILDDFGYDSSEIKSILGNVNEHHNDPNFPVVKGLYDLLDAIVADWGKEDLYHDVEDVVAAYIEPDSTTMSKEAIKRIKDVLENYDVLEDYAELVNNIVVKEPGEALSAMDRMYNSDNYVQAQRDMNESSPKKSTIQKMKEALKVALKTEKLDPTALKTAIEKGTTLNIAKSNASDISAAKSAKANFTTYE